MTGQKATGSESHILMAKEAMATTTAIKLAQGMSMPLIKTK